MKTNLRNACVAAVVIGMLAGSAAACTGIRLTAKDGAVIHARTMEFAQQLGSQVMLIPRAFSMQGTNADGQPGLTWQTAYAATGLNGLNQNVLVDGLNEKGLAGGIFYFPGYAEYQTADTEENSRAIAPWELLTWILTSFENVDQVRAALPGVKVVPASFAGLGIPTVHYIVHDASGKSLVVEYTGGELHLYDNPVGVITNSPDFDWHLKNLNNFVNLHPENQSDEKVGGLTLSQFGQGSGMLGLPGDFTPPSRFVRAVALGQSAVPGADGPAAVRQAFHVLDSFDIPEGSVRAKEGGAYVLELTQWTCASDLRNRTFSFHTRDNRRVCRVNLLETDLDAQQIRTLPLDDGDDVQNVTPQLVGEQAAPEAGT